jgi:hypothetical protein
MTEQLYYIICTKYQAGWNMTFWKPNKCGYTNRLDDAGKYTAAEAGSYLTSPKRENFAVKCEEVDCHAHRGVDRDSHLFNLMNDYLPTKKDGYQYNYGDIAR